MMKKNCFKNLILIILSTIFVISNVFLYGCKNNEEGVVDESTVI